ncbi:MAG: hypothetical protein HWN67_04725 [Candidatus Helarchaeota archaeon]|nr:hypothetical protein [Candidatus Helarchaeota archaeon]
MRSPRRHVAIEIKINEINENDKRVRILGVNISSTQDFAKIDDGTGVINVKIEFPLEERKRYRIIGQVSKQSDKKFVIIAEIVQLMDKLDMDLYQKVFEIKRKSKSTN